MELRVLRYFLMVAREQSFTKAAAQLHITQPTLSRQMALLEEELHTSLFNRNGHGVTLTDDGILLKRRALELIELEDRIIDDFRSDSEIVEGSVTIGCGEFSAVETLSEICHDFREKYPKVTVSVHTGTADVIREMMDKGLVDIGVFLEPVSTEGLDYIRLPDSDSWIAGMRPDDPLAEKEYVTREDLSDKPLIFPERAEVQSELVNWFGRDLSELNIAYTSNLSTNGAVFAKNGLGYLISLSGVCRYWDRENIVIKKLYPEIKSGTVIAWKRNIPYSTAAKRLIEELMLIEHN